MRHLALAVGIVQRIVDQLRRDAEAGGLVAVDGELELRRISEKVGRCVSKLGQGAHPVEHLLRPLDQLVDVDCLQRILESAAPDAPADSDVLRHLQREVCALHLCELRPQPIDDLRSGGAALVARLQDDQEAAGVGGRGGVVAAGLRSDHRNVGIAHDHLADDALQAHHVGGWRILCSLGDAGDQAGILDREEALRDLDRHRDRQRNSGEEDAKRDGLMPQHDVEGAPIASQEAVEARLDEAIDRTVVLGLDLQKTRAEHRRERQ